MVLRFENAYEHNAFQAWRRKNPNAFFLNHVGRAKGVAHRASCVHLGDALWKCDSGGLYSLAKRRKICTPTLDDLKAWAKKAGVTFRECKGCRPFDDKT